MKTPRELLLERHQAADRKLDALRETTVAQIVSAGEANSVGGWATLPGQQLARTPASQFGAWRELCVSLRWHLAGLSAAWALIVVLNVDQHSTPGLEAGAKSGNARDFVSATLRENRRQLLELSFTEARDATPAPRIAPGRRSESKPVVLMA